MTVARDARREVDYRAQRVHAAVDLFGLRHGNRGLVAVRCHGRWATQNGHALSVFERGQD